MKNIFFYGDGGWGMGDWGLGIGPNPQSPIPNPQSPIPNKCISFPLFGNKLFYNKQINFIYINNCSLYHLFFIFKFKTFLCMRSFRMVRNNRFRGGISLKKSIYFRYSFFDIKFCFNFYCF